MCDALTPSDGLLVQTHFGVVVRDLAVRRQSLGCRVPELEQQKFRMFTFRRLLRSIVVAVIRGERSFVFFVILSSQTDITHRIRSSAVAEIADRATRSVISVYSAISDGNKTKMLRPRPRSRPKL